MNSRFQYKGTEYFRIPVAMVIAERKISFPLMIYLELNQSLIRRFPTGETPSYGQLAIYHERGLANFVCPVDFYPAWLDYLKGISGQALENFLAQDTQPVAAVAAQAPVTTAEEKANEQPILDLEAARRAMTDASLSQAEKKAALAEIGKKMVGVMNDFASDDPAKKKSAYSECVNMTSAIVSIALQSHKEKSVYEDLLLMRSEAIEHSSSVSTIATILALTIGFVDEGSLANVSLGGLLHDVGLSQAPPEIAMKSIFTVTDDERTAFRSHPGDGAKLVKEFGDDVPLVVQDIVEHHHEFYSGTGFPKGLKGFQIDERVQIVQLADMVDDLMSGRVTGKSEEPSEAFEWLKERQRKDNLNLMVSPEIFEAVYQIVINTKPKDLKGASGL